MKKVIVILLVMMLLFSMTACGAAKNASAASPQSAPVETETIVEDQQNDLDDATEVEEVVDIDEVSDASTATPSTVDYQDYFVDGQFDLTGFAEALGYTWVPDPEWDGLAMYRINNGGTDYYLCVHSGVGDMLYGDSEGHPWIVGHLLCRGDRTIAVLSKGQDVQYVSSETLPAMVEWFTYMANQQCDVFNLPWPVDYCVEMREGTASYYDNGMIKQREFGEKIEGYSIVK